MVDPTRKHYGIKFGKEESLQYFQDTADDLVREVREKFMTPNGDSIRMPDGKIKKIPVKHAVMMFIGRDTVRMSLHFNGETGYPMVKKFKRWMKNNTDYETIESEYNPFIVHIYLMGPTPRSIYW